MSELKPSEKLRSLNGKRVRIVGFMAEMEHQPEGYFYLCSRPILCDESGDCYETWMTNPLPSPSVDSLPTSISTELGAKGYPTLPVDRAKEMGYYLRGQAGGRTFAVHTASDIPVSAYSTSRTGREPWRSFGGVQENTDIFFKIMRAVIGGY